MVKRGLLPRPLVVALVAFRAFLSFVFIIFLVAAVAVQRGALIAVLGVTVFACYFRVFSAKGILRLVVIKADLFPIVVGVAIRAGLSRSPLMVIVFLVAGVAGGRSLPVFGFGFVTGFALDLLGVRMRAVKGKISLQVVERQFVDRGDVFGPAFVLGVAFFTLALFLQSSVKAALLCDVGAHVLVTVLAELRLCGFVEALVASGAVLFPFGMAFDNLPGHERRFNIVRPGRRYREWHEASDDSDRYAVESSHGRDA